MGIFKNLGGKKGTFERNALIMSSGALVNVIISIGLYPVVTRLYSKEDFGGLGLFVAVVSLISLAGTSLYPSGLVIPKYKRDFYAMLKLSFFLASIAFIATLLFSIIFQDWFIYIFKLHRLKEYLYLIPVGVLIYCLNDIFINWNVRQKLFTKNASANVVKGSSLKLANIGYAMVFGASSLGLIVSQIVSVVLSILTLGIKKLTSGISIIHRISLSESFEIAKRYKKYPMHLLPANLVNRYTSDLPIYLLTAYFSPAITGAFVLANSIMNIPLNVIGNSLSTVFLQRANELYISAPDEMAAFAEKTHQRILYLGVLAFGVLFGFGDILFSFVFGRDWVIAGEIAGILSIYFVFKLIAGPMAKVFRVVGKEQYSLYVSIILALSRTVSLFLGVKSGDALTALLYFTIGNIIGYLVTSGLVFKACNLSVPVMLLKASTIISIGFAVFYLLRLGIDQVFDFSFLLVPSK